MEVGRGDAEEQMSISRFRKVKYTDDGCSIYQCLSCYKTWESRTDPAWNSWKFCPLCGCSWEGEQKTEEDEIYERWGRQYIKRHSPCVWLQIKQYMFDNDGELVPLSNWETIDRFGMNDYGIEKIEYPDHEKRYYSSFVYYSKVAKAILAAARGGKYSRGFPNNPFMFSSGFEMRIKLEDTGAGDQYFYFTDGIEEINWADTEDERVDIAFNK